MSVIEEIAAERRRQIEVEGWTAEHDDTHAQGEMAKAAACYVDPLPTMHVLRFGLERFRIPVEWPWSHKWWKPTSRRGSLIESAALIVAEIERMDRTRATGGGG